MNINISFSGDFGNVIMGYMKSENMSIDELSEKAGLSVAEINRICNHRLSEYPVVTDHLIAICIALRIEHDIVTAMLENLNIRLNSDNLRDRFIELLICQASADESVTVSKCNRLFVSEGLMPLTFSRCTA